MNVNDSKSTVEQWTEEWTVVSMQYKLRSRSRYL